MNIDFLPVPEVRLSGINTKSTIQIALIFLHEPSLAQSEQVTIFLSS